MLGLPPDHANISTGASGASKSSTPKIPRKKKQEIQRDFNINI
jgi:hypothetical protein